MKGERALDHRDLARDAMAVDPGSRSGPSRHPAGEAPCAKRRGGGRIADAHLRSEEHTSELQSLMRISYAVFCLKKKKTKHFTYIQGSSKHKANTNII